LLAGLAVLAVGLPLAWAVVQILPDMGSGDDRYRVASLNLPTLPSPPAEQAIIAAEVAAAPPALAPEPEVASNEVAVAPLPPVSHRRTVKLDKGDTLIGLLVSLAVPEAEAHQAMSALKTVYNPRAVQAGQDIALLYENGNFNGFEFAPSSEQSVRVERQGQDYKAATIKHKLERQVMAASAEIKGSLYGAGSEAGIPSAAMAAMIKALSYSVDFQRDIRAGDSFRVLYETMQAPDGTVVKTGNILFAEIKLQNRTIPIYRYEFSDGRTEYFDKSGKSLRKALLRTPVDGARMSSGFGMRRHPILGYSKMHKGTDFAAPVGTPIFAAGDGVIVERGRKGAYGNYIRIRHSNSFSTAYAHMSRFSSALSQGSRVKQGQVIGYVGTTGRSTGPHLHFETLINGAQVNPISLKNTSTGEPLSGNNLERFLRMTRIIERHFEGVKDGQVMEVAFDGPAIIAQPSSNN
jgi:murein DD-endopeptidase MepM/ murein hydrolase activator NlpD